MSRLVSLGIDAARRADPELGEFDGPSVVGRVARVDRGEVVVLTETDDLRVLSDSQRAQGLVAPVTGDWVTVRDDDELGLVVDHVFERRTAITRRDPAEQINDQVLVSNIDVVAVVHGLDQSANDARIERFLVLAIDSGAEPLIVLNKADMNTADAEIDRQQQALAAIAPIVVTSAVDGVGIDELRSHINDGQTLVLLGPSGVGKSSLVNALADEDLLATGDVREGDRRGRHTTTVRELIELPGGGMVIDTPGVRSVGLWAADVALDEVFADIAAMADQCKFRDCTHRSEPACAVVAAVNDGEIDATRLARYQMLWQELAEQAIELDRRNRAPQPGRRNRRRGR